MLAYRTKDDLAPWKVWKGEEIPSELDGWVLLQLSGEELAAVRATLRELWAKS